MVYNIDESRDEKTDIALRELIRDKLGIEKEVAIQRSHRLGAKRDGQTKPRPIIAGLRDYPDVELVMSRASRLRGTRIGISRDYPDEIRRARQKMEGQRRQARTDGKRATIAYPAKLIIDGHVTRDEFPDWNTVLFG